MVAHSVFLFRGIELELTPKTPLKDEPAKWEKYPISAWNKKQKHGEEAGCVNTQKTVV